MSQPCDRSFERLGAADAIAVTGETVTLPAGPGFDPGGIGKALPADLVCAEMLAAGAEGACVNLGGDVLAAGTGPGGGVATSTIGDDPRHHLIDPRTGQTTDSDLTLVTVVAGPAWIAAVLAKAVILAGSRHPFDILRGTGAQARAVDRHGAVQATPGWSAFLGDPVGAAR